ncbi:hypothetical protein G7Y41_03085 [Schaalia sp. ZJ405]|uniref:hypothetical protein n=1 Tax=Schaalia sp. ZJ405 TaxID=2709403 RepID=UPI0013EDBDE1|nr:hypothetical protein [Schaalia sp. ZJ405]QPK81822.1 hypothetical protein G7Y41_03085 [Schaalia sp. ZJ405]
MHIHVNSASRLAGLAAASALMIAACSGPLGSSSSSSNPSSGFGAARDAAARTEIALSERVTELSSLVDAKRCATCADALSTVSDGAHDRLQALGGAGEAAANNAVPLADAPEKISGIVSWMIATAQRDLSHAADPSIANAEQALALTRIALDRHRAAKELAAAYTLDTDAGIPEVSAIASRMDLISQGIPTTFTWLLNADDVKKQSVLPPVDLAKSAQSLADSTELSQAISVWDCVAQTTPQSLRTSLSEAEGGASDPAVSSTASQANALMDHLLTRSASYLEAGAADSRTLRCSAGSLLTDGESTAADSHDESESAVRATLARKALDADLSLLSSDVADIRLIGIRCALEDMDLWSAFGADGVSRALALT